MMQVYSLDNCDVFISKIRQIPDNFRDFKIPSTTVKTTYGIQTDLLDYLTKHDLPFYKDGKTLYYDHFDLNNIALHFSCPSIQKMAMRTWGAGLKLLKQKDLMITISLQSLASSSHQPFDAFILTNNQVQKRVSFNPQTGYLYLKQIFSFKRFQFDSPIKELLEKVSAFSFFLLPEKLRWNIDFIESTKMSECGGASKYLALQAKKNGLTYQHQYGILIAKPYSTTHFWTEFNIDGQWVAADPLLIKLLRTVARLDKSEWPIHQSPGACLLALSQIKKYHSSTQGPVFSAIKQQSKTDILNPLLLINNADTPFSLHTTFS